MLEGAFSTVLKTIIPSAVYEGSNKYSINPISFLEIQQRDEPETYEFAVSPI